MNINNVTPHKCFINKVLCRLNFYGAYKIYRKLQASRSFKEKKSSEEIFICTYPNVYSAQSNRVYLKDESSGILR